MNQPLLRDIRKRIREGLPTLALGGGMLCLLSKIQDSLGRTLELADVVPAEGEILWDLDQPAYIDVTAERDNLLLARGETVKGMGGHRRRDRQLFGRLGPSPQSRAPAWRREQLEGAGARHCFAPGSSFIWRAVRVWASVRIQVRRSRGSTVEVALRPWRARTA